MRKLLALLLILITGSAYAGGQWIEQSSTPIIKMGPFISDTDFNTLTTGATITQPDIRISKNGGDFAQTSAAQTATHDESGWYDIDLTAADTGTLGRITVMITESGSLPVWWEGVVVSAQVFDSLVSPATDYLQVDVMQSEGSDYSTYIDGRTLATAAYFVASTDTVANVTTTANLTTNNDKTGYTASTVSDKTGYSISC